MTLEEHLRNYVSLQRALLERLSTDVDLRRDYFNDLEPGQVVHDGQTWAYRGHGAGLTLEGDGKVVNAHVIPSIVDAVDAWRLSLYFDAQHIRTVTHSGQPHSVEDEGSVSALLEQLVHEGALQRDRASRSRPLRSRRRRIGFVRWSPGWPSGAG
jgi:hypothetical protein